MDFARYIAEGFRTEPEIRTYSADVVNERQIVTNVYGVRLVIFDNDVTLGLINVQMRYSTRPDSIFLQNFDPGTTAGNAGWQNAYELQIPPYAPMQGDLILTISGLNNAEERYVYLQLLRLRPRATKEKFVRL